MNVRSANLTTAGEREAGVGCPFCAARIATGDSVATCATCGTAHHRGCWDAQGESCGSYSCAPARRETTGLEAIAWKVTADELNLAIPLPPRLTVTPGAVSSPSLQRSLPAVNRLAIASMIVAVAGIPLFGAITGLVAILLGALALAAIHQSRQRGLLLAIGGLLLGVADVVGWIVFLTVFLSQPRHGVELSDLRFDAVDLQALEPEINQAMRANVFIQTRHGPLGTIIGSGVILRLKDGVALIVTNRHVVDPDYEPGRPGRSADTASLPLPQVKFIGQDSPQGQVIWLAPNGIDLALISVPCQSHDAVAARWQEARAAHVGAPVFAIGNPQALGWSYSQGAVSQLRTMTVGGEEVRMIQTNAAINPGNSGGGLYDKDGYLLGINTMTADKSAAEGLSFAITMEVFSRHSPPGIKTPAPAHPGSTTL